MVGTEERWSSRERSQCCRGARAILHCPERFDCAVSRGWRAADGRCRRRCRKRAQATTECCRGEGHSLTRSAARCMRDERTVGGEGEVHQRRRRLEAAGRCSRATRQTTRKPAVLLQATNAPFITATTKTHPPNSSSIALSPSQSIAMLIIELASFCGLLIHAVASSLQRGSRGRHLLLHPERAVRGGTTGTKCLAIL